ncbi:MAG TPA: hypothetical protein VM120_19360 [Bryobacteraceae bacterium]|nr:hypothetical protein [Bryobacteraceae bacterium]
MQHCEGSLMDNKGQVIAELGVGIQLLIDGAAKAHQFRASEVMHIYEKLLMAEIVTRWPPDIAKKVLDAVVADMQALFTPMMENVQHIRAEAMPTAGNA